MTLTPDMDAYNGIPANIVKPWKLPRQKTYILNNVKIIDAENGCIIDGVNIKLSTGRIETISTTALTASPDDVVVDLQGKYICPGLIDCHVHLTVVPGDVTLNLDNSDMAISHFRQPFVCNQVLGRGFTTVRDTGGATLALKEAIEDDVFPGPRLFISNKAISQTGGHGDLRKAHNHENCCGTESSITIVADGVPECLRVTRNQLRTGADFIKIMVGGGVASPTDKLDSLQFTSDEIRAITDVAASVGTYVTAHAYTSDAIRHAIKNGVKGIEHGNLLDADTAREMAATDIWLTPTLITYHANTDVRYKSFLPAESHDKSRRVLAQGLESLRIAHDAGVTICHGSDLLGPLQVEQSREFGIRAAVLSNKTILQGATVNAARMLGQADFLGQIRAGFAADLLVLDGNPLEDIRMLDNPEKNVLMVMKNGRIYKSQLDMLPVDVRSSRVSSL